MVRLNAKMHRFEKQGEKTGWTYIEIPADIAQKIKPNNKKSFRVKGKLDQFRISGVSLLPMGGGSFIMAINASMRKGIGKRHGAMVSVELAEDEKPYQLNKDFMKCLKDDPDAIVFFNGMPRSWQNYYSKWIESAKTQGTKVKRIAQAVNGLSKKQNYSEMIRSLKKNRDELAE